MRMAGAGVNAQIAHLPPPERTAWHHPLDGLENHPLRMATSEALTLRSLLDPGRMAGVPVVLALVVLAPGVPRLFGVDYDHVVAAIDMRRVARLMLSAEATGDAAGQSSEDEAVGIDQDPLL